MLTQVFAGILQNAKLPKVFPYLKILYEWLAIRPITCFSHVFMGLMRSEKFSWKHQNFSWFHLKLFKKISWKSEKLLQYNENFSLSNDIMRIWKKQLIGLYLALLPRYIFLTFWSNHQKVCFSSLNIGSKCGLVCQLGS